VLDTRLTVCRRRGRGACAQLPESQCDGAGGVGPGAQLLYSGVGSVVPGAQLPNSLCAVQV
jgi:hypothetical protein